MSQRDDILKVLLTEEQLKEKCAEMGAQITRDYAGKNLLLVTVLKGAVVYMADLMRCIDLPCAIDFMVVSSYGSSTDSSGEVRIVKDLSQPIEGMNVIIVEDIIDTGYTLKNLMKLLRTRNPKSLKICALLDKPSRRKVELEGDYVGFKVPNEFVVGYGLDYNEKYRNLPDICILKPEIYS